MQHASPRKEACWERTMRSSKLVFICFAVGIWACGTASTEAVPAGIGTGPGGAAGQPTSGSSGNVGNDASGGDPGTSGSGGGGSGAGSGSTGDAAGGSAGG